MLENFLGVEILQVAKNSNCSWFIPVEKMWFIFNKCPDFESGLVNDLVCALSKTIGEELYTARACSEKQ